LEASSSSPAPKEAKGGNDETKSNHHQHGDPQDQGQDADAEESDDQYELSEYERMRLERIQRNREYLARLGLEGKEGEGVLGRGGNKKRKKKKKVDDQKPPPEPTRSVPSRSSKTKARESISAPEPTIQSLIVKKKKSKPKKDVNNRMDKWIHQEFRRLQGRKTQALKQAERDVRAAQREIKYWTVLRDKKRNKSTTTDNTRKMYQTEKALLLGRTSRQFLREVDQRANELIEACELYDDEFNAMDRKVELETKRVARENEENLLCSHRRFSRAVHDARAVLNKLMLESVPSDTPGTKATRRRPKRSKETPQDDEIGNDPDECLDKVALEASISMMEQQINQVPKNTRIDDDIIFQEKYDVGQTSYEGGGWVQNSLARELDCSWLCGEVAPEVFDLTEYVPQVGDTLL